MIRLVSWNIALGTQLAQVLEGLVSLPPPTVIALQELSVHDGANDAERIARWLGPAWRARQVTAQVVSGRPQANGFVWDSRRLDVLGLRSIDLPPPSGRIMRRLPRSRRNALVMVARMGRRRLRTYSVHFDVLGTTHRHAQLARVLADALSADRVDISLIAGDMNTYGIGGRPGWAGLQRLAHSAGFEDVTVGIGWTHRRLGLRQKLDAVFASPRGLQHQARRARLPGSDHIPVMVEIQPQ